MYLNLRTKLSLPASRFQTESTWRPSSDFASPHMIAHWSAHTVCVLTSICLTDITARWPLMRAGAALSRVPGRAGVHWEPCRIEQASPLRTLMAASAQDLPVPPHPPATSCCAHKFITAQRRRCGGAIDLQRPHVASMRAARRATHRECSSSHTSAAAHPRLLICRP